MGSVAMIALRVWKAALVVVDVRLHVLSVDIDNSAERCHALVHVGESRIEQGKLEAGAWQQCKGPEQKRVKKDKSTKSR